MCEMRAYFQATVKLKEQKGRWWNIR